MYNFKFSNFVNVLLQSIGIIHNPERLPSFVDSLITAVIQNEAEGKKEQRLSVEDADEDVFTEPEGFNSDLEGEVIEQVCYNGESFFVKAQMYDVKGHQCW